jgi:hypothetical protein
MLIMGSSGTTDTLISKLKSLYWAQRGMAAQWRTGNDADLEKGADVQTKGGNSSAVDVAVGLKRREMVSLVI